MPEALFGLLQKAAPLLLVIMVSLACGEAEPPSRDHYPVIQAQVYRLQEAIRDRNRAAIDSLATVDMLDIGLSSDSLLKYVYGPGGMFPFHALGNVSIVYTDDKARVDCFVMDTTRTIDRPVTLTFVRDDDTLWLLKRFEDTPEDSSASDTGR